MGRRVNMETFGRFLINEHMPEQYKVRGGASKGALKKSMTDFAKKQPDEYVKVISNLKRVGDELATTEGLSLGLDDIAPEYKKRDRLLKPIKDAFNRTVNSKYKQDLAIKAHDALLNNVKSHPGSLTLQVSSGARGNWPQYARMSSGVGYARDAKGGVIPWIIERSYAEGLKASDYWALTNQSMNDVIKTQTAVSEPGELAKKLVSSMSDAVITEVDCGTHNGILVDTKSNDALDRYVAKDEGVIKRNTLITPTNQSHIAKSRPQIWVRSPMTCEAADGICQHCQGLDEKGNTHTIGVNVGVRSAQAMSEPLTQFALNAKHGGRTLDTDKFQVQGIKGFRQITESPKTFENKATLSTLTGTVEEIREAPQGGFFIGISGKEHYTPPGHKVLVKKGNKVQQGDMLCAGIPKPDEVVRLKGLGEGRNYMVSTLHNLYSNQGKDLDRRHFELLAKSNMNFVRVLEDPSNTYIKGDVINYNTLVQDLKNKVVDKSVDDAIGDTLGVAIASFAVGTRITNEVAHNLKRNGVNTVKVAPRAPEVEFMMKSSTNVPKMSKDWLARLSHQGLKRSIMQAAHFNEETDFHGTHPVPAYVMGSQFGEGESGHY
jgi:DNA-directed RNA polymerase subunit beta'